MKANCIYFTDDSYEIHKKYHLFGRKGYGGNDYVHYELVGGYVFGELCRFNLGMAAFYHHIFGLCVIFINHRHYIVKGTQEKKLHFLCCLMTFLLLSTYVLGFFLLGWFVYVLHVIHCVFIIFRGNYILPSEIFTKLHFYLQSFKYDTLLPKLSNCDNLTTLTFSFSKCSYHIFYFIFKKNQKIKKNVGVVRPPQHISFL